MLRWHVPKQPISPERREQQPSGLHIREAERMISLLPMFLFCLFFSFFSLTLNLSISLSLSLFLFLCLFRFQSLFRFLSLTLALPFSLAAVVGARNRVAESSNIMPHVPPQLAPGEAHSAVNSLSRKLVLWFWARMATSKPSHRPTHIDENRKSALGTLVVHDSAHQTADQAEHVRHSSRPAPCKPAPTCWASSSCMLTAAK